MKDNSGLQQRTLSEMERPYRDEGILRRLYYEKGLSMNKIADRLGCSQTAVRDWMDKHGLERRSISETKRLKRDLDSPVEPSVQDQGYVVWYHRNWAVHVHRLLAASEFGVDALEGMHVHHKNGIPWDNRPDNLELITNSEHQRKHLKVPPLDRIRIAELYENGDCSYRVVHEQVDYDVSQGTIREIHHEFYRGENDSK